MTSENVLNKLLVMAIEYGPKLIGAIAVWFIGAYAIKLVLRLMTKMLDKRKHEASLNTFLKSLVAITLKTLLVISVMSMIGIEMTSFIAILGAAGLAIGMALSGTLQNLAGGVMILLFKPFKVGDTVSAQGHTGLVQEIQIFNTILSTADNKTIIIPNGGLSTSTTVNFSIQENRRVEWSIGVASDDFDKARASIETMCNADARIMKDPATTITLTEIAGGTMSLSVKAWVKHSDYSDVAFNMIERAHRTFTADGIKATSIKVV